MLKYLLSRKLATRLSSYILSGRNFAPSIFRSPVFPGITGPSPPWSGGLGLWASGMALSSGASGTTGFALGTAGGEGKKIHNSQTVSQSLARPHARNYNDLLRIIFYYLLIRLPRRGKVIFACVAGVWRMKARRGGGGGGRKDELGSVGGNTAGIPVAS